MARILFAWQLGNHYGHLTADLPVAEALRAAGHDVFFAVRDPRVAEEVLSAAGFDFLPVPLPPAEEPWESPASYAEILLAAGYSDESTARGITRSWMSLLELIRPDVVVADHAPMALVCARARGTPAVTFGSGFTVPPPHSPCPSIRSWQEIPPDRLHEADRRALERINAILLDRGRPPLRALSDLFAACPRLLTIFPELDCYGPRTGCEYVGPIAAPLPGTALDWASTSAPGRRIFAYLRPSVPRVDALLTALEDSEAEVICAMPGASRELARHFDGTRITLMDRAVPLEPLLPRADLVVTYGGQGMIASSLLAGVPLLLIPQTVEQYLNMRLVERLGAGIGLGFERDETHAAMALRRLLTDSAHRDCARRFARRYEEFNGPQAALRAAASIASQAR